MVLNAARFTFKIGNKDKILDSMFTHNVQESQSVALNINNMLSEQHYSKEVD